MYAVQLVLQIEGGFVDDGVDHGGATNFGITEATARRHGFNVRSLTRNQAISIYYQDYWLKNNLHKIKSKMVATELFDSGVNCGTPTAAQFLQEAYNTLFTPSVSPLLVDGSIGDVSVAAVNAQLPRYEVALFKACNGEQYTYYKQIKKVDPAYGSRYIRGWTANRL